MRRFLNRLTDGGGQPSAVNPLSLPGLELYLRSDQVVGTDGSLVSAWPDISGFARNGSAVLTERPTLRRTGAGISPKGLPAVEFNGTVNSIVGSFPAFPPGIPYDNGYTIYLLANVKAVKIAGGGQFGQAGFTSSGIELMVQTSSDGADGYPVASARGLNGFTPINRAVNGRTYGATVTGYQLFRARFNSPPNDPPNPASGTDQMEYFVTGVKQTINANPCKWNITMNGGYNFGNVNAGGNQGCNMYAYVCLVFSRTHSNGIAAGVEAFLRSSYG